MAPFSGCHCAHAQSAHLTSPDLMGGLVRPADEWLMYVAACTGHQYRWMHTVALLTTPVLSWDAAPPFAPQISRQRCSVAWLALRTSFRNSRGTHSKGTRNGDASAKHSQHLTLSLMTASFTFQKFLLFVNNHFNNNPLERLGGAGNACHMFRRSLLLRRDQKMICPDPSNADLSFTCSSRLSGRVAAFLFEGRSSRRLRS
jgi:hypothetical protein